MPLALRTDRIRLAGVPRPPGRGAGALSRAHVTASTEAWLRDLWSAVTINHPTPIDPGPGIALACSGSLARRESGPLSDLDLELVLDGDCTLSPDEVDILAERLWYPLWDTGLGLDHAVRTVEEARETARADLATAAAALDLRCIAGDDRVVARLASVLAADWRTEARHRLPELEFAVSARHARHGDIDQTVDPDLKEAAGGLRDMVILRALAASWLADYSHERADHAHHVLLDTRDALQLVTGRARNRLVAEEHAAVAALLRLDPDDMLTRVALAGRTVERELQSTLSSALRARTARPGPDRRSPELRPLGAGAHLHEGEVVLGPGADPSDPLLPLVLAGRAASVGAPLSTVTARNLARRSTDLPTPWPAEALGLLVGILSAGPSTRLVWDSLDDAGLITRWIPPWTAIRGHRPRHPVHRWTVDRHSVECVVVAAGLVDRVDRPDILLLAALLHDIGKVAGSDDHSRHGADIVARLLPDLGAAPETTATVTLLVREHLTLAQLATRADPDDPRVLDRLGDAVQHDTEHLELLAALTEADSRATGTGLWNATRAAQVRRLVTAVQSHLEA